MGFAPINHLMKLRVALFMAGILACAAPASAQISFEVLGARALGMGGAFVAVVDDATLFHWNPAGLLRGAPASMTVGWDKLQFGNPELPAIVGATMDSTAITSVTTWPMGISYGYFQNARVVNVEPDGTATVAALRLHHLGGTFAYTVAKGVEIGTTVKWLKGQASLGNSALISNGDALNEGLDRRGPSDGAFDLDVGVSAEFGPIRLGMTAKNLTEPRFAGNDGFEIQLKRRYRMGVAALLATGLTLAFDMDLDTADPQVGQRRMFAVGGEGRLGKSVEIRSGIRWSRDGDAQPIGAVGGSVRIRGNFWIDSYATYSKYDNRGWGIALRAGS